MSNPNPFGQIIRLLLDAIESALQNIRSHQKKLRSN